MGRVTADRGSRRNIFFISFSQFGAAFSFNFILIFLPFYVGRISPYSLEETLLWIGAIMGAAGLCLAISSPLWGYLSHLFSPKALYLRGFIAQALLFFLMGFTTSLPVLLILRILQGMFGGISTIGIIIVSSSSPADRVGSDIGLYQNAMTLGQLVGPPLGTLAAVAFGYRWAFIAGSAVMIASAVFCYLYVTDIPRLKKTSKSTVFPVFERRIVTAWMLCFVVQVQIMFLPSVLPNVFQQFGLRESSALNYAGFLVMLYTITALAGTTLWCSLAKRTGLYRMIVFVGSLAILCQFLLVFCSGIVSFIVVRMIQAGLIAAVVPLTLSIFANEREGSIMGFLNSARFVGNALGPFVATSVLAVLNLSWLYVVIGMLSVCILASFVRIFRDRAG